MWAVPIAWESAARLPGEALAAAVEHIAAVAAEERTAGAGIVAEHTVAVAEVALEMEGERTAAAAERTGAAAEVAMAARAAALRSLVRIPEEVVAREPLVVPEAPSVAPEAQPLRKPQPP